MTSYWKFAAWLCGFMVGLTCALVGISEMFLGEWMALASVLLLSGTLLAVLSVLALVDTLFPPHHDVD